MKILFLNVWHGLVGEKLREYVKFQASKIDIFCFVEIDPPLFKEFSSLLPGYTPVYSQGVKTMYLGNVTEGRAVFVRKNIKAVSDSKIFTYRDTKTDAGGAQFVQLNINGKDLFIGNVHGKARPGDKFDTPARITQSRRLINFFKDKKGPKIIAGDFNLMPDTKSISVFEDAGYRNLTKEFNIKSTRNQVSWDQFASVPGYVKQYFADFCFVSPEIKVINFEVPYNEVSDHLPQILEFDMP